MHPKLQDWLSDGSYLTVNNLRIFYKVVGRGPVLLIIHGYPYNGIDFEKVLPILSRDYTVIVPDMPGMGLSDKPVRHTYTFSEMADVYSALLQFLSISEIHLLSHDLGNSIAQELMARDYAKTNPFAIRSIVFLNGGLFSDVYRPRLIQILLSKSPKWFGRLLSNRLTKRMVLNATAELFGKNTKPSVEVQEIFWEVLNYNNGKSIAYLLGRLVFEKDKHQKRWITAMQQTSIPMCFINGPSDPNSGIHMANRYRELIPNAIIYLLNEDIGHWPQIEDPMATLDAFFDFHTNNLKGVVSK